MLTLLPRRVDDSASTEPGRPPEIEGAVRKAASRRPIQDNARTEYAREKEPSEQSNGGRRRGLTRDPCSRNPAGVISMRSWEVIKQAMREEDVVIYVEGEEDLLALPCIVESPDGGLVLYGQPSQGLVVVETKPAVKKEAGLIIGRMIRENVADVENVRDKP